MNTEKQPPKYLWIDKMSTSDAIKAMLKNQAESFDAVEKALPEINNVIEKITQKLKKNANSRLIYAGAGTSARIGLQDAVELYLLLVGQETE